MKPFGFALLFAIILLCTPTAYAQPTTAPTNLGWGDLEGSSSTGEGLWLYYEYRSTPGSGTRYEYRRKTAGGDFGRWVIGSAESLGGDKKTFELMDFEWESHATYTIELRAADGAGYGPANAITFAPKWPNPPQNVQVTSGNEQLTLTWDSPLENSCTVIGYSIRGGGRHIQANDTQVTITGLTNGTTYEIYIEADAGYDAPCLAQDSYYMGDGPVYSIPVVVSGMPAMPTPILPGLSLPALGLLLGGLGAWRRRRTLLSK